MGDQRGEEPEGDPGPALVDQRAAEREQQEYAGKNAGGDFAQPDAAAGLAAVTAMNTASMNTNARMMSTTIPERKESIMAGTVPPGQSAGP